MVDQFLNGTAGSGTGHPIPEPDSFVARFRKRTRFSIGTEHNYTYNILLWIKYYYIYFNLYCNLDIHLWIVIMIRINVYTTIIIVSMFEN